MKPLKHFIWVKRYESLTEQFYLLSSYNFSYDKWITCMTQWKEVYQILEPGEDQRYNLQMCPVIRKDNV